MGDWIRNVNYVQEREKSCVSTSHSLSLNSAIFSAVCLGSRLDTNLHVFAIVICAIELFALLPLFRYHIIAHFPRRAYDVLTMLSIGGKPVF